MYMPKEKFDVVSIEPFYELKLMYIRIVHMLIRKHGCSGQATVQRVLNCSMIQNSKATILCLFNAYILIV